MKFLKIKSADMPTKPKPTEQLPNNLMYVWDPNANDWIILQKDTNKATPPLYDPNNQNVVNQTTNYMSTVKSSCLSKFLDGPRYSKEIKIEAGLIKDGLVKYAGFDFNKGTKYAITIKGLEVLRKASEAEHNEALNEREKLAYMFGFNTDKETTLDTTGKTIKSDKKLNTKSLVNKLYSEIKKNKNNWEDVDDLSQYTHIDTKEEDNGIIVYVRTELSYDEMMKLAEILNKVVQKFDSLSYFEPLQPGIMQAYIENKKSASLNKFAKQWTICEADGAELGEVEAKSELDAKVKFGIEHPEYAESLSICAKEIKSGLEYGGSFEYNEYKIDLFTDTDGGATFVIYAPKGKAVNHESMYKGTASTMDEAITKAYNIIDGSKEINAQYEQTTETHEPYPNPSETPHDDIVLENHDGWVNTASFEDDIRKQFQQPHQKLPNSDRDLELLEKQVLYLIDEDKKEQIKALFDRVQFSDKEAAKVTPEFAKLHELLGKYKGENLIQLADVDGNLVASGDPQVINNLEHEVKDIGYYCESVSEDTDSDYAETYSLKIFMK